jgi:hypothetical protein
MELLHRVEAPVAGVVIVGAPSAFSPETPSDDSPAAVRSPVQRVDETFVAERDAAVLAVDVDEEAVPLNKGRRTF